MKNKVFISVVFGIIALVSLMVWQASTATVSLVLLPSDLAKDADTDRQRLRVAGRIAEGSIDYKIEPQVLLKFRIHDPEGSELTIPVEYRGVRPDMFAAGRDVILDGNWQSGLLIATKLMTQCPSKYEPPDPNRSYEQ